MAFNPVQARDSRGRFTSTRATAAEMEEVGVFAKDIEGFILGSVAVQAAKRAKAMEVAEYWRSIAPVRGDKDPKGSHEPTAYGTNYAEDYETSIKVHEDDDGVVYVGSDLVPLADWLEYGSIHNPEHGYGARVLAHFGGGAVDAEARLTSGLFVG